MVKHEVGFAGESFGTSTSVIPVATALFTRPAGADPAAAAHVARDSIGAVFFLGAVDLDAVWTGGHRLGQRNEGEEEQSGTRRRLHDYVEDSGQSCQRLCAVR